MLLILVAATISYQSRLADSYSTGTKIAWIYDTGFYTLKDELDYLKSYDPSKYGFDEYNQNNINDFWAQLNNYHVVLIDEDVMYDEEWTRLAGPIYDSFRGHRNELAAWILAGGGLFITDNNDLGASTKFPPNELVWDWLPTELQVMSADVGVNASRGNLRIVHDPGLFSRPNELDERYVNGPRGHAHGYFIIEKSPSYTPLMIRIDLQYLGQPVEIYRVFGRGVIVLSHAELEDGFSPEYIENEINFVALLPESRLLLALDGLKNAEIQLINDITLNASETQAVAMKFVFTIVAQAALDILFRDVLENVIEGRANSIPDFLESKLRGTRQAILNNKILTELNTLRSHNRLTSVGKLREGVLESIQEVVGKLIDANNQDVNAWTTGINNEYMSRNAIAWDDRNSGGTESGSIKDLVANVEEQFSITRRMVEGGLPPDYPLEAVLGIVEEVSSTMGRVLACRQPARIIWYSERDLWRSTILGETYMNRAPLEKVTKTKDLVSTGTFAITVGAIGAYAAIKILSAFVTLGAGAIAVEGIAALAPKAASFVSKLVDVASAAAAIAIGVNSLYMFREDVLNVMAVGDDTLSYVEAQTTASRGQLPLIRGAASISTPDIVLKGAAWVGSQTGTITVTNQGASDADLAAFIYIYEGNSKSFTSIQNIPFNVATERLRLGPGQTKTIQFDYMAARSSLLNAKTYFAELHVVLDSTPVPVAMSIFHVGSAEQVDILKQREKVIASGTLGQGEKVTAVHPTSLDAYEAEYLLTFKGSRLNLHLFDEAGRHVGVDYATNRIDMEIEGATYSGPAAVPQWIKVVGPHVANRTFTLEIVGFEVKRPENYLLLAVETPHLPPVLTANEVYAEGTPGTTIESVLSLSELGGHEPIESVRLTATELTAGYFVKISRDSISFSANNFDINPGSTFPIVVSISVPSITLFGNYTGSVVIQTQNAGTTSVSITVNVIQKCLVLTVAYESELAPEVLLLRQYRDKEVMKTFAGRQFMGVFNALYYSFSPDLAKALAREPQARQMVRFLLSPLIHILRMSAEVDHLFGRFEELGVVVAGFVAASLIGIVYFGVPVLAPLIATRKRVSRSLKAKDIFCLGIMWMATLALIVLAEAIRSAALMSFATLSFVTSTLIFLPLLSSLLCIRIVNKLLNERMFYPRNFDIAIGAAV